MNSLILTPSNIDFANAIYLNSDTGQLAMPILTFSTAYNPYYNSDPLNDDPNYHKRVIDCFYLRLTEKWLYKVSIYRSLLKYFTVQTNGEEGKVKLISDPDRTTDLSVNKAYDKYIFKYIEKYFITRSFVAKVLKEYIKVTKIKWYDLFHNTDTLKSLFAHKLKKLIVGTIYELDKTGEDLSQKQDQ